MNYYQGLTENLKVKLTMLVSLLLYQYWRCILHANLPPYEILRRIGSD